MTPKQRAGEAALDWVQSGMRLGLGTGSTVRYTIEALGARLADGRLCDIVGVPTSEATAELAIRLAIPLVDLGDVQTLDLAIDGADEVDSDGDLIKGLGGALIREKIVAAAAAHFVVVVDQTKLVSRLGTRAPLPVEVEPFAWRATAARIAAATGSRPSLRLRGGEPVRSDNGHLLLDCDFPDGIADAGNTEAVLRAIPGVYGTGLFLGFQPSIVIAGEDGGVAVQGPPPEL